MTAFRPLQWKFMGYIILAFVELHIHIYSNLSFYFLLAFLNIRVLDDLVLEVRVERSEKNENFCVMRE